MPDALEQDRPPEMRFTVTYDGPALAEGRMDARELGTAILSTARLIERAGAVTFPGEQQISVEVDARFRDGSFEVDYSIVSWVQERLAALSQEDLKAIWTLIFGSGGAVALLKFLRGRKPDKVEKREDRVEITTEGEHSEVNLSVYNFVTDQDSADALRGLIDPIKKEGIERVEVAAPGEETTEIEKDEAEHIERPPSPEEEVDVDRYTATLEVVSPHFRPDHKWQFSHGETTFWARIQDEDFLDRVEQHDVTFGMGDRIRALVELETLRRGRDMSHMHRVLKVHRLMPVGEDQLQFPGMVEEKREQDPEANNAGGDPPSSPGGE